MKVLVIATRNKKKKKELKVLLKEFDIKLLSPDNFKNVPRVEEKGRTFRENAIKKALIVSRITGGLTLADDSGLEVKALGGKPGVFSSRFSGKGANDLKNNRKLLHLLKNVPMKKRGAQFVCTVAIAERGSLLKVVEGKCRGRIGFKRKGKSGFGYDPIFIASGHKKTFAQLGAKLKNKISHRAKALKKAKQFIAKYLEEYS